MTAPTSGSSDTPDLLAGVWIGFDKPRKIMADAQGGRLAAPRVTRIHDTEVYRRKPAPPDWLSPQAIVTREIDLMTRLLPDRIVRATSSEPRFSFRAPSQLTSATSTRGISRDMIRSVLHPRLIIRRRPSYVPPQTAGGQRVIPGASPTPVAPFPDTMRQEKLDTSRDLRDSL